MCKEFVNVVLVGLVFAAAAFLLGLIIVSILGHYGVTFPGLGSHAQGGN
jgi:hypothetical protein